MRKLLVTALAIICAACASNKSGDVNLQNPINSGQQNAKVVSSVSYRDERFKLAKDPNYKPYALAIMQKALIEEHFRLANDPSKTIEEINDPLKKLLEIYPLGIQANFAVANFLEYVAKQSGNTDTKDLLNIAKEKREKGNEILRSILESGSGKTAETAFQVINTTEEYAVLEYMGLKPESQSLVTLKNRSYDILTAKSKTGSVNSVYFDISAFYNREIK